MKNDMLAEISAECKMGLIHTTSPSACRFVEFDTSAGARSNLPVMLRNTRKFFELFFL